VGQLRQLHGNDLLVTPLAATLNFKLEDIDAQLLAAPRIRARNHEKAKIMIGDRVPTITNTVTPLTTGSSVVTGSVSYQDVGLKLEIEPQVYADNEVGIKMALEVSNIAAEFTDAQGGRSYQIGTRNATTNLRLKDGETQILGGLINDEDRNTATKIPGLGHLPVVGRLFGNNAGTGVKSEIVLAITPHIVRNLPDRPPEARSIFSGTLNVMRDKPILAEPPSQLKFTSATTGTPNVPATPPVVTPPPSSPGSTIAPTTNGVLFNALPPPPSAAPPPPASGTPPPGMPVPSPASR
jgi:general secretion pathway protein D